MKTKFVRIWLGRSALNIESKAPSSHLLHFLARVCVFLALKYFVRPGKKR